MTETAVLIGELVLLFFAVTFLVQLFQRRMGGERLRRWMGGTPLVSALKGITIGFMTPFCTFTAIPMLLGLRQAGVSAAGYVAFIVAAPVLDPVLFGALVLIVGMKAALVYASVAFLSAMTLALAADRVGIEKHFKELGVDEELRPSICESTSSEVWSGFRREARSAAASAVLLLRVMAPLLAIGIGVSLLIEVAVPEDLMARVTGAQPDLAIPIAAAIGTPMYFSTELFVPIADSLRATGVGIGAIVALTIAGAGANLPEFVILSRLARPRLIAVLFSYVIGVALLGGLFAESIVAG